MKKILYDESSIINMAMFGIEVPALKSRKLKTMEALLSHEAISAAKDQWLISSIPVTMDREDLSRIHTKDYRDRLFSENPESCLMESYELLNEDGSYNRYDPDRAEAPLAGILNQVLKTCAGTYYGALIALEEGFCYYMGGGMHHGHKNFGHGFCPTNDIMAAAARLLEEQKAGSIWIIDADAHKGDGTAEMAGDFDAVKTLSIHMAHGWPMDSQTEEQYPSDVDIPIESGEEGTYTKRLLKGMESLEEITPGGKPDLAIVLLGADPYEKDELDSTDTLNLTEEQLLERDKAICSYLDTRRIPAVYTMAGGYGSESWRIHYNFLKWVQLDESDS